MQGTVPVKWKNLVEEHSDLSTQEKFTLGKIVAYELILNNSPTQGGLKRRPP